MKGLSSMHRKRIGKSSIIISTLLLAGLSFAAGPVDVHAENGSGAGAYAENGSADRLSTGYSFVSVSYKADAYSGEDISFSIGDVIGERDYLTEETFDPEGHPKAASVKAGDKLNITIDVPKTARYCIGFDYISRDESILPIEFGVKIDGDYPFFEMRSMKFETTWTARPVDKDRYGNEIVALPDKLVRWEYKEAADSSYRYSEPFAIELTEGTHELELDIQEGSLLLGDIRLTAPKSVPEYGGSKPAEGNAIITLEAENFTERNDSSIHATGEYSSKINPLSADKTVLNVIDEDSFNKAGQRVTYGFDVETSGYYYIGMTYRQSEKNDFPVFVDYRIDGEIPSTAFKSYPVEARNSFGNTTLKDIDGNNLSVYLERGSHSISLTISADNLRYALEKTDAIMSGISDLSLEVTKVAGTNTDKYRDLRLARYIPDIKERLENWAAELRGITEQAQAFVGAKKPDEVAAFSYLLIAARQLEDLAEDPNELVYRVGELSTGTNSINTQIANFVDLINDNDLAIDRIYLYQEGAKLPGGLNIFASVGMSVKRFFSSFFGQSYSVANADSDHVQVWVNRPRTYVEIMQKMIDESFTKETGIEVDLCLMTDAQKLILSNASGDTPDIASGINYSIPYDLAIRGALVDMTEFEDYKEVFGRYSEGMIVPSVVGDGLYSLPETMNFYVMFYRTDILSKLGLTPPDTIDELIAMLPDLQMRGLNVYYPTAPMQAMRNFHGTTPLIFQNGGSLYGRTARDITVDSEATVEGFTELTELFTLYNLPVDVPNFYQHFRNGDLPLGIADFNSYNLILNAAPEIANSWAISLVPGVTDPDSGLVLRYMSGGAESSVMFKSDRDRESKAWRYLEWWSRAETQAEFGQRLQILYGDEYIWPTANIEAFAMLPYPTSDKEVIMEQAQYVLEAPRLPGSYMMEREMSNAFNDVVVNGETVRSRIDEVVKTVSRETDRKLEEFGFIDSEGNVLTEYLAPDVESVRRIMNK